MHTPGVTTARQAGACVPQVWGLYVSRLQAGKEHPGAKKTGKLRKPGLTVVIQASLGGGTVNL
jgi:hypothetical protein